MTFMVQTLLITITWKITGQMLGMYLKLLEDVTMLMMYGKPILTIIIPFLRGYSLPARHIYCLLSTNSIYCLLTSTNAIYY